VPPCTAVQGWVALYDKYGRGGLGALRIHIEFEAAGQSSMGVPQNTRAAAGTHSLEVASRPMHPQSLIFAMDAAAPVGLIPLAACKPLGEDVEHRDKSSRSMSRPQGASSVLDKVRHLPCDFRYICCLRKAPAACRSEYSTRSTLSSRQHLHGACDAGPFLCAALLYSRHYDACSVSDVVS
jgi:hypothetical protein